VGIVTFPGSLDDRDAMRAVRVAGAEPVSLWHGDADLHDVDAVIVPGGFSYGDYLRAGAIARFAPVMGPLVVAAREGMPVLGICNGFQVLCETHLLPGALVRNVAQRFICRDVPLVVDNAATAWTSAYENGQHIVVPIKNIDGCFVGSKRLLDELEATGRVVVRYADGAPNGSMRDIAGVCNETGTIVGMMPHPEHAIDDLTGPGVGGLGFFTSLVSRLVDA